MATNPQIPPDRKIRDDHAKVLLTRPRNTWWPLVIIVVAAAILIALIVWLPRSPHRPAPPSAAQVPPQPTSPQVQLTGLQTSTATPGGAMNMTGTLVNNGNTSITGIQVKAIFRNITGQPLKTVTAQMEGLNPANGEPVPFTTDPVSPGASRNFEIRFERVPEGWNHNLPDLAITNITAEGK
jgi:hypothetical protein